MDIIKYVNDKYDINDSHNAIIDLPFDYDDKFTITAIIGGSGTGKTTLLRKWFDTNNVNFNYRSSKSIVEILYDVLGDVEETFKLLFDVGLSSVPVWKNNYNTLSNGEKLRFEIAYKIASNDKIIYVDEFTSMLDRQVAKNLTLKIRELILKYDKRLVVSTAHFDVLDWLKVDRLVDTTLKKSHSPQTNEKLTHINWKSIVFPDICGEYLSTITI